MTASQQPTGHDKAVMAAMACIVLPADDEHYQPICYNHRAPLDGERRCSLAASVAAASLAAHRAALAAGDTDVAGPVAEVLGLHRRVMWDDNRSDRKGEAVWFQTTPVWTWTEAP